MRMSDGVEWAAHACALLAALPEGVGVSAALLAEFNDLPPAYMAKHMQALARAGVVTSARGAGGGYRLARPASEVTLWDIVEAVEGPEPAFRCTEIRQKGPCAAKPAECRHPCQIAAAFHAAEKAWRGSLKAVSLASILADLARKQSPARRAELLAWLETKL
ncbi:MAG: Rrf2 family transcriptional regulator [Alphaproteobacteria bacterium]|nr:Rrf2 family transcriptional regulator [Alphaproteobacteria bacterium]